MNALTVSNLCKEYPAFTLDHVSFSVGAGRVCGLIGANGAGKTTTLKGITGFLQTQGSVEAFGISLRRNESAFKQIIGYVGGGFRYYPQKTASQIARVAANFYTGWSEKRYGAYLSKYGIDENKKISALSEGMKVKFFLSLALSHDARLLILDEPTSGLDPLSREEFCDTVLGLVREEGVSVLFSTHITSDLMRIADDVVYLSEGKVLADEPLGSLLSQYSVALFPDENSARRANVIGFKAVKGGFEGLVAKGEPPAGATVREASLDDIMIGLETERRRI